MSGYTIERYHDISCGHRVYGHESKCAHLHGHNYRVTFTCAPSSQRTTGGLRRRFLGKPLDEIGRVVDFSVVKSTLCQWLEDNWDHKMLLWEEDPLTHTLQELDPLGVCVVAFNPTAEAMAQYLAEVIGPALLAEHGVVVTKVRVEETRKCSASFEVRV